MDQSNKPKSRYQNYCNQKTGVVRMRTRNLVLKQLRCWPGHSKGLTSLVALKRQTLKAYLDLSLRSRPCLKLTCKRFIDLTCTAMSYI